MKTGADHVTAHHKCHGKKVMLLRSYPKFMNAFLAANDL